MERGELGRRGEAAAAKYYMQNGYTLLDHNYRTRMGELDLVLLKGEQLVIAEVKTRTSDCFARPCESVDIFKQKRLILAARSYLQHSPYGDYPVRFDVVEVIPVQNGWKVHCIPDAFQC